MEQYYFVQPQAAHTIIPKINYQGAKNWYIEGRYNWEELQTASFHFGRSFDIKKIKGLNIKPVAGICFGQLNGGSLGAILEYSANRFTFSSEPQYVFSFREKLQRYVYSWSEATYEISPTFYSGAALQHTKLPTDDHFIEPGILAGFSINNFDIPFYCFQPFKNSRNFVIGVNWHWQKM